MQTTNYTPRNYRNFNFKKEFPKYFKKLQSVLKGDVFKDLTYCERQWTIKRTFKSKILLYLVKSSKEDSDKLEDLLTIIKNCDFSYVSNCLHPNAKRIQEFQVTIIYYLNDEIAKSARLMPVELTELQGSSSQLGLEATTSRGTKRRFEDDTVAMREAYGNYDENLTHYRPRSYRDCNFEEKFPKYFEKLNSVLEDCKKLKEDEGVLKGSTYSKQTTIKRTFKSKVLLYLVKSSKEDSDKLEDLLTVIKNCDFSYVSNYLHPNAKRIQEFQVTIINYLKNEIEKSARLMPVEPIELQGSSSQLRLEATTSRGTKRRFEDDTVAMGEAYGNYDEGLPLDSSTRNNSSIERVKIETVSVLSEQPLDLRMKRDTSTNLNNVRSEGLRNEVNYDENQPLDLSIRNNSSLERVEVETVSVLSPLDLRMKRDL
ncbi:MAG: hypothetical protein HRK26_04715 [Rickettsiaceae bacterium H1]|nr:hypothetical protein [Rickettsiaceae bacterium H1]